LKKIAVLMLAVSFLFMLASCGEGKRKPRMVVRLPDEIEAAPAPPASAGPYDVYIAHKDDDLNIVARNFGVGVYELMRFNNIVSPQLREGQAIYIPRKGKRPGAVQERIQSEPSFIWPLRGKIATRFGDDIGGAAARYILIKAEYGANVEAAKSGVVIMAYEGDEKGLPGKPYYEEWGNFVWIAHGGGEYTVYAHLFKTFKNEGAKVTQGETIGMVGASGDIDSAALRFSIYQRGLPVDPVPLLP